MQQLYQLLPKLQIKLDLIFQAKATKELVTKYLVNKVGIYS